MHATDRPGKARSPRSWLTLAALAAAILLYVLLVTRGSRAPIGTQGPAIGHSLGYLHLDGLTGDVRAVALDDLAGRVSVIHYWGTWCPPCIREFPDIVALVERFEQDNDFRLYAVSCGQQEDAELGELRKQTAAFLAARSARLPTYADRHAASRKAMLVPLGLTEMAYPTTVICDRRGTIRGFWQGYHPHAAGEMTTLVAQLLDEPLATGDAL